METIENLKKQLDDLEIKKKNIVAQIELHQMTFEIISKYNGNTGVYGILETTSSETVKKIATILKNTATLSTHETLELIHAVWASSHRATTTRKNMKTFVDKLADSFYNE